jgi:small subunit ribosomal protein S6
MNIECDQATLEELESGFRFNDAILRSMTLVKKEAVTEGSLIATANAEEQKVAETKAAETKAAEDAKAEAAKAEVAKKEAEAKKAEATDEAVESSENTNSE